jgi:hypothetical protein
MRENAKTSVWYVMAKKNHDFLGEIRWHFPWRQYVFIPNPKTIYEDDCLGDIRNFLLYLDAKKEHKEAK